MSSIFLTSIFSFKKKMKKEASQCLSDVSIVRLDSFIISSNVITSVYSLSKRSCNF